MQILFSKGGVTMSNQNKNQNTENLSEILQIRRDKLTALQEAGQDPFLVTTSDRDIMSSEVVERFEEEKRDMKTNDEVRASKEYVDAFARYMISENDKELRTE